MKQKYPPQLKEITHCDIGLGPFSLRPWPIGLPAVAINGLVIAGFQQKYVFDYVIEIENNEEMAMLFRSLHFELSSCELALLSQSAKKFPWFPLSTIFSKYQVRWNHQTEKISALVAALPTQFLNYCHEKKWSYSDFTPLLTSQDSNLADFFDQIITRNPTRSEGTLLFEFFIDLLQMGNKLTELLPKSTESTNQWISNLKKIRYPRTHQSDIDSAQKIQQFDLTGTSSAKWVRMGDKAGIELRFFVSQPSDLKKISGSINKLQIELEKDSPWEIH